MKFRTITNFWYRKCKTPFSPFSSSLLPEIHEGFYCLITSFQIRSAPKTHPLWSIRLKSAWRMECRASTTPPGRSEAGSVWFENLRSSVKQRSLRWGNRLGGKGGARSDGNLCWLVVSALTAFCLRLSIRPTTGLTLSALDARF